MPATSEETLKASLVDVKADERFSEAVLLLSDESRLCFRHRVGERWAKAVGAVGREDELGIAGELLSAMAMFRLNAKHLDISFQDGSRWNEPLQAFMRPDD